MSPVERGVRAARELLLAMRRRGRDVHYAFAVRSVQHDQGRVLSVQTAGGTTMTLTLRLALALLYASVWVSGRDIASIGEPVLQFMVDEELDLPIGTLEFVTVVWAKDERGQRLSRDAASVLVTRLNAADAGTHVVLARRTKPLGWPR